MAEGFEYFTSASAGAPTLTSARGSFITLLDWVLVAKGGWEKPFSGANLAAYRSTAGNRFYLRVDDQIKYARIRGYRNMTAISTGTQAFPTTTQAPMATWGVPRAYTTGTAARRYWGIRTNRYVKIFIEHFQEAGDDNTGQNLLAMFAFGDVPSLTEGDGFATTIVGMLEAGTNAGQDFFGGQLATPAARNPVTHISIYGAFFAGNPAGNVISTPADLSPPYYVNYGLSDIAVSNIGTSGRLLYGEILYMCANQVDGAGGLYPRAKLPSLFFPYGGGYGQPDSRAAIHSYEEFSQNGRDFIALPYLSGASYATQFCSQILLQKNDTGQVL